MPDFEIVFFQRQEFKNNLREAARGRAIKAYPPPPSGLMAIGTFFFSL